MYKKLNIIKSNKKKERNEIKYQIKYLFQKIINIYTILLKLLITQY